MGNEMQDFVTRTQTSPEKGEVRGSHVCIICLTSGVKLDMRMVCGINSVGRVSASQAECRRFKPGIPL